MAFFRFFLWLILFSSSLLFSVDEHLGCFLVLGIVDRAAVNVGMHVCCEILVSAGCMLRRGLLDRKAALVLAF